MKALWTKMQSGLKPHGHKTQQQVILPLYCDDCGKKRSRWAAGPGRDNSGKPRERCNCNCGGWWVSHWAHHSRRRRIAARSAKMEMRMKVYREQRRLFLLKHPRCAVFKQLKSTQVHHVRGRTAALLLDERFWKAVSAKGHRFIHEHPEAARARGLLARKGEWNENAITPR